MMRIGVTGAHGFIGRAVIAHLHAQGFGVRALPRCLPAAGTDLWPAGVAVQALGPSDGQSIDPQVLAGCDVVVHCAALAHVERHALPDPLSAFRSANRDLSIAVINAAVQAGLRRCVFISSIGVCGLAAEHPLAPSDPAAPVEPYQIAKWEAEEALRAVALAHGIELVILRLPLLHGPGAPGNLARLCHAIARRRLLPVAGITGNRRSFLGIDNACSAITQAASQALKHSSGPQAASGSAKLIGDVGNVGHESEIGGPQHSPWRQGVVRVYHLADPGVISTRQLVEILATAMGVRPRMCYVPRWILMPLATIFGQGPAMQRLCASLPVDSSAFCHDFAWTPPLSLEAGLQQMAHSLYPEGR